MPLKQEKFTILVDNLSATLDVDDGTREVPVNMTFEAEGFLTKDTGVENFANTDASLVKKLFNYKKKDGTQYFIRSLGTKLEKYDTVGLNFVPIQAETAITGTVATTSGSNTVTGIGTNFSTDLVVGQILRIGAEIFYITAIGSATSLTVHTNSAVNGSGVTLYKNAAWVFSSGKKFGLKVYNDIMYGCNSVDPYFEFDGTRILFYPTAPKGDILEVFEDRMFVAGVTAEPLSMYYSNVADAKTFAGPSVLKPIGTDQINGLANYYGSLLTFKRYSIWKMTFVYDQVAAAFLPKLEILNANYGLCAKRAYTWVENDIWFFTGTEVRAIGFKDQQTGVLGINPSVISNQIKETLRTINTTAIEEIVAFYNKNQFYLALPLNASTFCDTIFVCHLLYKRSWTKIKNRIKASVCDFVVQDDIVYSASGDVPGRIYKWNNNYNDAGSAISCYVNFKTITGKDFSATSIYRYLDLRFKNLEGLCGVRIWSDSFDVRIKKEKTFYIGVNIENEENSLGEVGPGQMLVGDAFGESISTADFLNRRVSFLAKGSSLQIGLFDDTLNGRFTLAQFVLEGMNRPRRYFSGSKIVSM